MGILGKRSPILFVKGEENKLSISLVDRTCVKLLHDAKDACVERTVDLWEKFYAKCLIGSNLPQTNYSGKGQPSLVSILNLNISLHNSLLFASRLQTIQNSLRIK